MKEKKQKIRAAEGSGRSIDRDSILVPIPIPIAIGDIGFALSLLAWPFTFRSNMRGG